MYNRSITNPKPKSLSTISKQEFSASLISYWLTQCITWLDSLDDEDDYTENGYQRCLVILNFLQQAIAAKQISFFYLLIFQKTADHLLNEMEIFAVTDDENFKKLPQQEINQIINQIFLCQSQLENAVREKIMDWHQPEFLRELIDNIILYHQQEQFPSLIKFVIKTCINFNADLSVISFQKNIQFIHLLSNQIASMSKNEEFKRYKKFREKLLKISAKKIFRRKEILNDLNHLELLELLQLYSSKEISISNQFAIKIIILPEVIQSMPNYHFIKPESIRNNLNRLVSQETLFYSKDPILIFCELIKLLLQPSLLDQGDRSLCGMASFCLQLLINEPHLFVKMTMDLICDGKTEVPLKITATPGLVRQSKNALDFVLQTLRNHLNFFLAYRPTSQLEGLLGASRPKDLVVLLKTAGYQHLQETILVHNLNDQKISRGFNALLGGVYSNCHYEFNTRAENFRYCLNEIANHNYDCIIFLLRMPLVHHLVDGKPIQERSRQNIAFFIPIEFAHFLNITGIREENNKVHLTVMTYGQKIIKEVSLTDFIKYFDGAILANSPSKISSLTISVDADPVRENKLIRLG